LASIKKSKKLKRSRGRPVKEESIALNLEKEILDYKEAIVKMVPQAHKVLLELMTNKQTKDNIRQGIAQFVIEEGKQFLSDFFDEEEEHEEDKPQEVEEDDEEDDEFASPLSTEIKK
jgi:hypothetical protein